MNRAENLLNEVADYIASTLEQPNDSRAWAQLLVYCPNDLIADRYGAMTAPKPARNSNPS